ncbi:MAG: PIG-L family deacetylase [Anaerolineaceae bacterium]|nr:PIG-L family deacetylase [Anaerolineaceae bacterium]MDD4042896.1 PIG-L family deacetylase [Anaerolineaceae bacterium]MDD4577112.1 PIG-L family deacetylase [Anaerolineaceae bacterium]
MEDPINQAVFLSPHYDDAVLSCGGTLNLLRRKNISCSVITLFAGSPTGELSTFATWFHGVWKLPYDATAYRREENRKALIALNAQELSLDFQSSIYRRDPSTGTILYNTKGDVFGGNWKDDDSLLFDLIGRCRELLTHKGDFYLIAPLGVGNHIDHLLTQTAASHLSQELEDAKLTYYEELPYATQSEAVPIALRRQSPPPQTSVLVPLSEEDLKAKYVASKQYQSQLEATAGAVGISIEEIINYGKKLGQASGLNFTERFWFTDSHIAEQFSLATQ